LLYVTIVYPIPSQALKPPSMQSKPFQALATEPQ
jgi:hypothetical protein